MAKKRVGQTSEMDTRLPAKDTGVTDFAQMQTGEPYSVFRKKIPAKLNVKVIDPFTERPVNILLKGMNNERSSYVELWNEREYVYFLRANRIHLDNGDLIEHKGQIEEPFEKSFNNLSDDEMRELISSKFFTLKSAVDQMTTEAPLIRLVELGEIANKPEKTMLFLRSKLSIIQSGELET